MLFTRKDFGDDFKWGVSTAAYQIEGAHAKDGKGSSIWDTFVQKRKKILNQDHGNIACDFYHHYAEDIALLYKLNIPNFRFSLAWSRIFPLGTGAINYKGIDFYNRLIDFCLEVGIDPWVTIYHWDLPDYLHKKGGWTNREIVDWFGEYVATCSKYFGDRVKNWMVLNEPMVFTGAGYFLGVHAPGKKGLSNFLAAAHHATLCQAEGGRILRSLRTDSSIGTTFSYSHIEPARKTDEKDNRAVKKVDALINRFFIEPLLGMGYPTNDFRLLQRIERFMYPQDEKKLAFDMDFIGLQNYTREIVQHNPFMPFIKAKIIKASKRVTNYTLMDWEVYPPSIYEALKQYDRYENIKEIIVTENGAAFTDQITGTTINDDKRVRFLQDYIGQVLLAKNEGVKVNGYFVWTLLDNFEWAEGFHPRFGIVYVDFNTQERIVKNSGKWYSHFLQNTLTASSELQNNEHFE
ncbi:MAG: GH1 family beta-glucosidase [Chitinophagaceae bacterium]